MTKIDLVRKEMMQALKDKNMERKGTLTMLLSALKSAAIDKRSDLTEDEENAIVYKEIKTAQESIDTAPKDRTDVIEECQARIKILTEFAPERMGEAKIKEAIQKVLDEQGITSPTVQDKGKIMKALMPLVKGKADGGLVNKLVGEMFQ
ncbi:MAG: GatB/YqeY domain-containing protein [Eubacteriales bacterium]